MTAALVKEFAETVEDGVEGVAEGIEAHHTNVFVVINFEGPFVKTVYGPFRSFNSAKDWGNVYSNEAFTVMEIMRPRDVEDIAFVPTPKPHEPTLEDQGISQDQTQIGDYIDPNIGR